MAELAEETHLSFAHGRYGVNLKTKNLVLRTSSNPVDLTGVEAALQRRAVGHCKVLVRIHTLAMV